MDKENKKSESEENLQENKQEQIKENSLNQKNENIKQNTKEKKKTKKFRRIKGKSPKSKEKIKENKNSSEDNLGLDNAPLLLQPLDSSMKKKHSSSKKGKNRKKRMKNENSNNQNSSKQKTTTIKKQKLKRTNSKPTDEINISNDISKIPKESFASSLPISTGRKELAKSIGLPTKANLADQMPLILLDPSNTTKRNSPKPPKTPKPSPPIPSPEKVTNRKKRSQTLIKKKNPSLGELELKKAPVEMRRNSAHNIFNPQNMKINKEKEDVPIRKTPVIPERLESGEMLTKDNTSSSDDELFDFGSRFLPKKTDIVLNETKSLPPNKIKKAMEFQIPLIQDPNDTPIDKKAKKKYSISQLVKEIKATS